MFFNARLKEVMLFLLAESVVSLGIVGSEANPSTWLRCESRRTERVREEKRR